MSGLLINIDVPDIGAGAAFYTAALGLRIGRRFGGGFIELCGAGAPIYLLEKKEGTKIGPGGSDIRRYERHWSPVHLDLVVDDLGEATARAVRAGAVQECETVNAAYGRLACSPIRSGMAFASSSSTSRAMIQSPILAERARTAV
jgi:catechol 2,3-dioxygenase-like lactoylglutathione lyase family enzyme